ncbi:MAG: NGG1p interacting factor NIF3 [Campylobacterota bacterium]
MLYQLIVYVPTGDAEHLKEALFAAGAGKYKHYDRCSWECGGTGQFRPLQGANPAIGRIETVEYVPEVKIETVCTAECLKKVLRALRENHPYEEPAYGVIELKTLEDFE